MSIIYRVFVGVSILALVVSVSCSSGTYNPSARSLSSLTSSDAVLILYRNERLRPLVIDYFTRLTESRYIAETVLETCNEKDIPPSLAFAIAWNESRFNPHAINYNHSSVDRGLFQLNSRTFSALSRDSVYDPKTNSHHAMDYLREGLERTGSIESALAYYNSGIVETREHRVPSSTRLYVKSVISDRDSLDKGLVAWIYFSQEPRLAME